MHIIVLVEGLKKHHDILCRLIQGLQTYPQGFIQAMILAIPSVGLLAKGQDQLARPDSTAIVILAKLCSRFWVDVQMVFNEIATHKILMVGGRLRRMFGQSEFRDSESLSEILVPGMGKNSAAWQLFFSVLNGQHVLICNP